MFSKTVLFLALGILPHISLSAPTSLSRGVLSIPLTRRVDAPTGDTPVDVDVITSELELEEIKIRRGLAAIQQHQVLGGDDADFLPLPVTAIETAALPAVTALVPELNPNYGSLQSKTSRPASKGKGSSRLLRDRKKTMWYGDISVGTPPKTFTVNFDTGSTDLFLPGSSCMDQACNGHRRYDPSASSTSSRPRNAKKFRLDYGDGSQSSGQVGADIVRFSGLAAYDQSFGIADHYSASLNKASFETDGLLGLAFRALSQIDSDSFFESLVKQRQLSEPVFAFSLKPAGGELTMGGVNASAYVGKIAYAPVMEASWWTVKMDTVTAGGLRVLSARRAIIDTGTTLVMAPRGDAQALYARIPGSRSATDIGLPDGYYTVPCKTISSTRVGFTFAGRSFPVVGFNFGPTSSQKDRCVGSVVGSQVADDVKSWVIGGAFLSGVYSVYDLGQKRVGFAEQA